MDLPYTINFRLTSLFLAAFTWEICSFIFVPFNRSFNRYPPKEKLDNDKVFLTSTLAMKHLTGLCKLFRFFLLRRPWQAISLVQLNLAKKEFQCKHGKSEEKDGRFTKKQLKLFIKWKKPKNFFKQKNKKQYNYFTGFESLPADAREHKLRSSNTKYMHIHQT